MKTTREILLAARKASAAVRTADTKQKNAALLAMADRLLAGSGAILAANGVGFEQVIKTTCFLADMGDFAAFNEEYAKAFTARPARSCVAVKTLPKNVLCEIEAIAAL